MSYKLINIEGIGEKYEKLLAKEGFVTTDQLLPLSKKDMEALANKTGINIKLIDKWQEMADLMRIKGVAEEYSEVLNLIGIDSVKELAQRNPENTLERIKKLDEEKPNVIRKLPTLKDLKDWIEQAKKLPQGISNK